MKKLFQFGGILGFCVVLGLVLKPLFVAGLFDVHDPTSIVRFYTLKEVLGDRQIPAAWHNSLNNEYGYPLFLYYAPVFSYLGVLISFVTPSLIIALKIAITIVVVTAAWGMYSLMRPYGRSAAWVSVIAYTLLPYHASTLYVRGSYAEAVTWALLPWLLSSWRKPLKTRQNMVGTAVISALFFMSHNTVPFFFLPFLGMWVWGYQRKHIKSTIITLLMSIGLFAWFLSPVIFENSFVQAASRAIKTEYKEHFLLPMQLWHSPWGYGGSASLNETDGMSFMLGKFQILLAALAVILFTLRRKWSKTAIFFSVMSITFAFGTTTLSSGLWDLIPQLALIQFPWRLLTYAGFGIAALGGLLVVEIKHKTVRIGVALVSIVLLVFFNAKFFTVERYIAYSDSNFTNQSALASVVKDKIPEYLPHWMPQFPSTQVKDSLTRTPTRVIGTIDIANSAPITVQTAYMPQWMLTVDGTEKDITPTKEGTVQTVDAVEIGRHTIELTWKRTIIEQIGIWITILTIGLMIGLVRKGSSTWH